VPERTGVVMVTRNRRAGVLAMLERLDDLPACVVDNASADGTVEAVRSVHPRVEVVALERNRGAAGRNVGARRLGCELTAFVDDDSWWAPGALDRAEALFAARPRLGLAMARVLVGPERRLDPVCAALARDGRVLGFVACGAVVRTEAFLAVGGFDERYGVGGEERLLAVDLAAAGWELAYAPELVAHHHPAAGGRPGRRWRGLRNELWTTWLRRPARRALAPLRGAPPAVAVRALAAAARGLPWVLRERRPLPPSLEADWARLDG